MLAHVGGDDGLAVGEVLDGLQHLVGVEHIVLFQGQLLAGEHLGLPLGVVVGGKLGVEQLQHSAGVSDDVVVGENVFIDLRPVNVDMYDFGLFGKDGGVGGHPVREAAADGNEQIALGGGDVGGVGAVHTHHAGEQGVVAGTGAAAHDGGAHRGVQGFNELAELGYSPPGANDAASHQHHGAFCLCNQIQQLLNVPVVGLRRAQVSAGTPHQVGQAAMVGVLGHGQILVVRRGGGDVLGDIHQHRAGTAGTGDGKGLPNDVGQLVDVLDQVVALGDGHGDTGDIHLLEGVLADKVLTDVAGDEHHRGGVIVGGGDASDQVGGAGAGGGKAYTHLSGGPGVAVGGVAGSLLMGGEVVVNFVLVTVELKLIVNVENGTSRIAEHRVHALLQQTLHHNLRTPH